MQTIRKLLKELLNLCEDKQKAKSIYLKLLRAIKKEVNKDA